LYFSGWWPHTLSWQLYSNTQPEATFYWEGEQAPFNYHPHLEIWQQYAFDGASKLQLDYWAFGQLGVPMFATSHAMHRMGAYLCRCVSNPDSAGLYILTIRPWGKPAEKMEKIPCKMIPVH
jgi:hypothetical protein